MSYTKERFITAEFSLPKVEVDTYLNKKLRKFFGLISKKRLLHVELASVIDEIMNQFPETMYQHSYPDKEHHRITVGDIRLNYIELRVEILELTVDVEMRMSSLAFIEFGMEQIKAEKPLELDITNRETNIRIMTVYMGIYHAMTRIMRKYTDKVFEPDVWDSTATQQVFKIYNVYRVYNTMLRDIVMNIK